MTGFDNGTLQSGVFAQTKQFGSVLRGFGPPVPTAGAVGDAYMDVQTGFFYVKRSNNDVDPWGDYLLQIPVAYQPALKWFSAYAPTNDFGVTGDYCIALAGYANYGTEPSLYGPKAAYGWSEIGEGPSVSIDPVYAGAVLSAGLTDEGAALPFSTSTQLVVIGLLDEYILALPVLDDAGTPVSQLGLPAGPVQVPMPLNPLYTANNEHTV